MRRRVVLIDQPHYMVADERMGRAPRDYHDTALGAYEDLALTLMLRREERPYWFTGTDEKSDERYDKVLRRLARWLMWVDTL